MSLKPSILEKFKSKIEMLSSDNFQHWLCCKPLVVVWLLSVRLSVRNKCIVAKRQVAEKKNNTIY